MNDELNRLRDAIALREASLRDAQAEFDRGELDAARFSEIQQRDLAALEALHAQLEGLKDDDEADTTLESEEAAKPRRTRRRWQLVLGILCLAAAIAVPITHALRAPHQLSAKEQSLVTSLVSEGETQIARGNIAGALAAYDSILLIDPNNVTALTQSGWFYFTTGSKEQNLPFVDKGVTRLRRAVELAPRSASAQLYYAIAALSTPGNRATAKDHMEIFLSLSPSRALLAVAAPYRSQLGL